MTRYTGGCQCGQVSYEVEADLDKVMACNCSRCGKIGSLLTFVPAEQFTLKSGEDSLTDFQFNNNVIHHLFCKTCGVESFAKGKGSGGADLVAINARCLDGVDIGTLTIKQVDGRSF